jgi:hypothetical protein
MIAAIPTASDLALPRWTWVAWLVHTRQQAVGPRPVLPLSSEAQAEARRLANLRRDLVPS